MTNKTTEFLKLYNEKGPWILTSIHPDRKGIETKTFDNSSINQLEKWVAKYNGERNLYFHVNSTLYPLTKKADRKDIKSVDYLHVDIDPREGYDLNQERDRTLDLLMKNRPKGVPAPTCIIFSGGGYQGFWKLKESIKVDGDIGLAEDAKRYNQQLEHLYAADNCHNIDRIMRLPGTMNIPDARKRKKGRVETEAYLVEFDASREYDLSEFNQAQTVQTGAESFSGGINHVPIQISGNIERLVNVDDLDQWDVPDRLKVVIVQGRDPENPKNGDNSRSAWVFDCVCNLIRFEVPDDVIFSIMTDPEFGIAASILEQKGNVEKYAIRQIERAKEHAIDPWLVKLNEQFAVIGSMGGKCRIVEETYDAGLKRSRLTKQSFEDFRNRYLNKLIQVGETQEGQAKFMPVGKWWLINEKRRQYDFLGFYPGESDPNTYNLWRGFSVPTTPGDCEPFLDHIRRNVCSNRDDLYDYVIGWMARCVQSPDTTGQVALVLRGGRGTGKSFFAKQFGALFGRHFMQVSNSGHLVGNFNSHLRDVVLLFADEAFYAGDRKHASVLKTLITEETIPIEAKGVDIETAPNYVHLIMASNDMHVIPAGGDERRFLVLDVGNENKQDTTYFSNLAKKLEDGGYAALLHFLMSYDLSEFNVHTVPQTDALREQKLLSLHVEEEWWYQKLYNGTVLQNDTEWQEVIPKEALVDDFIDNAKRFNVTRRGTATSLGRFLGKLVPNIQQRQMMGKVNRVAPDGFSYVETKRMYHYILPSLEECRKHWDKSYGKETWPITEL